MAKIGELKEQFKNVEGFILHQNIYEQIQDVTLPTNYEIISKRVNHGLLEKIEFCDSKGTRYLFEG